MIDENREFIGERIVLGALHPDQSVHLRLEPDGVPERGGKEAEERSE